MRLYKTVSGILVEKEAEFFLLSGQNWDAFINNDDILDNTKEAIKSLNPISNASSLLGKGILPPVGNQELWACGVTYLRSKVGRQEESKDAGGGDFYARVYEAERPEVFFKATPPGLLVITFKCESEKIQRGMFLNRS
jgi:2-dehydro-3-deoxy-D-arabinonate dehydratase